MRDPRGRKIIDQVRQEYSKKGNDRKKYLSSVFWVKIYELLQLSDDKFGEMPDVDEDERELGDELAEEVV